MKFITINQSVRSLSNEALAALAAGAGLYAKAASKEAERRNRKRTSRKRST